MEKLKKPRKLTNQQILVGKLVNSSSFSQRGFWPREIKMASKLIKEYNLGFLMWVIPPYNKKVPSLAYFMADYGQRYLEQQFFNYKKATTDLTPKPTSIILEDEKVGKDVQINKQPKTLQDFLKLYTKKYQIEINN